jgi:hypothetical protein
MHDRTVAPVNHSTVLPMNRFVSIDRTNRGFTQVRLFSLFVLFIETAILFDVVAACFWFLPFFLLPVTDVVLSLVSFPSIADCVHILFHFMALVPSFHC